MRSSLRRPAPAVIGIALAAAVVAGALPAQDKPPAGGAARGWPMFGGTPRRNMVNLVEKNVPTDWSVEEGKHKNVKWVAELGEVSYGGPVVAGGKVFVGTNNDRPRNPKVTGDKGILMCFRAADGKFLWQAVHDKLPSRENDFESQGIASTPTVEGNRVYYVSNRCELVCADTEGFANGNDGVQDEKYKGETDADIVWRLDMMGKLGVFPNQLAACCPLIVGDLVFVVTGNGTDGMHKLPAPKAPSFIAVNKKDGAVVWQSSLPGDRIVEGQWSNPAYAEAGGKGQVLFPGGDGWLYSLDPKSGELIWKFDCNPKKAAKPGAKGRNYPVATPVVHDNKVYLGVGHNPEDLAGEGHLWCIDATKKGDVSPVGDNFDPKAAENKNSALVWHFGGPIMPKPERGRRYHFGRTVSTCAVHDGLVYTADGEGFFYCLDAQTGRKVWEHDLLASVWGSPMWVDGKVYLGAQDGNLYVFQAGREKKLLNKVEMDGQLNGPPVVVDGVVYVMTPKRLYAIAAK